MVNNDGASSRYLFHAHSSSVSVGICWAIHRSILPSSNCLCSCDSWCSCYQEGCSWTTQAVSVPSHWVRTIPHRPSWEHFLSLGACHFPGLYSGSKSYLLFSHISRWIWDCVAFPKFHLGSRKTPVPFLGCPPTHTLFPFSLSVLPLPSLRNSFSSPWKGVVKGKKKVTLFVS